MNYAPCNVQPDILPKCNPFYLRDALHSTAIRYSGTDVGTGPPFPGSAIPGAGH